MAGMFSTHKKRDALLRKVLVQRHSHLFVATIDGQRWWTDSYVMVPAPSDDDTPDGRWYVEKKNPLTVSAHGSVPLSFASGDLLRRRGDEVDVTDAPRMALDTTECGPTWRDGVTVLDSSVGAIGVDSRFLAVATCWPGELRLFSSDPMRPVYVESGGRVVAVVMPIRGSWEAHLEALREGVPA